MALRRLLTNKGYSFAEELDVGLLDKQFRRPFALAETDPPPKTKRRRKQDPFGDDDDGNGDEIEVGIETSLRSLKTEEEREREDQLREERAREARQWDAEFSIRRNVDRGSNALLRDQFVLDTKHMYASIRERTQQYRFELDQKGVFDSAHNQVRALCQKRVLLAKTLKLEEIKGRTVQEVVTRIIGDLKKRFSDRDDNKDTSDGLEDVLRAEEQMCRLLGDSEYQKLGCVEEDTLERSALLHNLKEIAHDADPSATKLEPVRTQSSANRRPGQVDDRQNAFERILHELRQLDPSQLPIALELRQVQVELRQNAFERVEEGLRKRAAQNRESSLLKTPFAILKFWPRCGRGRWPHTLKTPCFFDPMPKFKWTISGAPKKFDWQNQIAQPTNSKP